MRADNRATYAHGGHFGERLRTSKFGHKMTRELYAYPNRSPKQRLQRELVGEDFWEAEAWVFRDEAHTQHSDAYLLWQRDAALVNFDLSMRNFASLGVDEFEAALEHILAKGRTFKPVQSLQEWDGVAGAYIMVFDGYRQFYIGQSEDIRKRIKRHWGGRKSFDRLVYGTKYNSIFPVDELRALDTTRIYAARSTNPPAVEQRAESAADQRFCLNRMIGGSASPLMLMLTAAHPRSRANEVTSVPLSREERDHAKDGVLQAIAQRGPSYDSSLVTELANLDMTIYSVDEPDGTRVMWSRRDAIADAAARGDLCLENFADFLEAMGENIIWPRD